MTTVVALEGLPFTGKTSSIGYASEREPEWAIISEYHDIVDSDALAVLAHQPSSGDDQYDRISTYLALDERRWQAIRTAITRNQTVLVDRCHLSITAYSIALHECLGLGDPEDTLDRYQEAIDDPERHLRAPDAVIMLSVGVEVASDRLQRLSKSIDPTLTTPDFVSALIAAYELVLSRFDGAIQTVNAELALPEVQAQAFASLQEIT